MAHQPPTMPSANPTAPSATYTPLRTRKPITATARSNTATSEMTERTRARGGEVRPESATRLHHPLGLSCDRAQRRRAAGRADSLIRLECGHHRAPFPGLVFERIVGSG